MLRKDTLKNGTSCAGLCGSAHPPGSECYIFCVQTKVIGNIKFCCLIITPFVS